MMTLAVAMAAIVALIDWQVRSGPARSPASPKQPPLRSGYANLPMSFEENRGQTDARVKFLARGRGYTLFLTATDAVLKLRAPSSDSTARREARRGIVPVGLHSEREKYSAVRIRLEGANPASSASGVDQLSCKTNYFIGKDAGKWHKDVPSFAGVKFHEVYPGIDLIYRGSNGHLEYDYAIAPGADPDRIKLHVDGADRLALASNGDLIIKTAEGDIVEKAPVIYQKVGNTKHPVKGGYVLCSKDEVAFKLEAFNKSQPLIIDPLLTYVSYLGGSATEPGGDEGIAIAVDSTGAAWIAGDTVSIDFPVTSDAFQSTNSGGFDVFISKFNPDGSTLEFSTYAGGSNDDTVTGIAIDPAGNVYVAGPTYSPDYPVTIGAYQTVFSAASSPAYDDFVTALDSGGGLIYSTFLGEQGAGKIAVDSHGDAAVVGFGESDQLTATSGAFNSCSPGEECAFLTELNPTGTGLVYSANYYSIFVPAGGGTEGAGIGFDGDGNAYFTGTAYPPFNFPAPPPVAFVAKLDPTGSSLFFEQDFDAATPISFAVEPSGNSHVLLSANQPEVANVNSIGDATVVPLPASIGYGGALAVDPSSNIFVVSTALGAGLITTPEAFQPAFGGGDTDAYFIEFDPSLSVVLYATYLGGSGGDSGNAVTVDSSGNAYVTGYTSSDDFPVTPGAYQTKFKGETGNDNSNGNAFVARIVPLPKLSPTPTETPTPTATSSAAPSATATSAGSPTATSLRTPLPTRIPTPSPTPTLSGDLLFAPKRIEFRPRIVGISSALRMVLVHNPMKSAVSISSISVSSGFAVRKSCPNLLPAHQSCVIEVTFTPTGAGLATGALTMTDDAANSPQVVTLGGNGVAAATRQRP